MKAINFGFRGGLTYDQDTKNWIIYEPLFYNKFQKFPHFENYIYNYDDKTLNIGNFKIKFPIPNNIANNIFVNENSISFILTILNLLPHSESSSQINTKIYTEFVNNDEFFIFPYNILNYEFFYLDVNEIIIPDDIINLVKSGKAVVNIHKCGQ